MAAVIEIIGPNTVTWGGSLLGRGDNDDLFKIDIDYKYYDVKTNQSAEMIADAVRTGATVTVNFSLIVIDRTTLTTILGSTDGGQLQSNAYPKVGSLGGAAGLGSLVCTGSQTITVPRCRVVKWTSADHGNKPTRFVFTFEALPSDNAATPSLDNSIYTIA